MRVSNEEFQRRQLRVHSFLNDVPLHDVWAFRLRGGGEGLTLVDFEKLLSSEGMQRLSNVVNWLFRLRLALGRWFGWEDEGHEERPSSYVSRLTADDRIRSIEEPGSASRISGPLSMRWPPVVYSFENESLHEIINATGHHFLLMSMEPAAEGYTVYWAVYTKSTSWLTLPYMMLIDPFRRLIVYPGIIRKMEAAWARVYGAERDLRTPAGTANSENASF